MIAPPVIIPVTEAPAQQISVALNAQSCLLNIYTKSVNVPSQPGSSFQNTKLVGIAYGVSLNGNTMVVSGSISGVLPLGATVTGNGIATRATITGVPAIASGLGTYTIDPPAAVTLVTRVTAYVLASGGADQIPTDPPVYENRNPVFIDVFLNDIAIVAGVLLLNKNRIVRNSYLGFLGDFAIVDTEGNEDPVGVSLLLPPVALRNPWQRSLPLALAGRAPLNLAGRIPGFGSRFLLTYWPDLT